MPKYQIKNNLLKLSWVPYALILFEMLYMATPLAVFFYSIYEVPLKFLNSSPYTAWILQTVFPHFVETNSPFIGFLLRAGWLFMGLGLIVFLIAFVQIYYAKFTKKGAVTVGLYRFIRHPQYTAWTLFGFGMSMVWSRIIVWIMFVTMMFVYYLLAKTEEKECTLKFPETYIPYLKNTGMFFPKIFNRRSKQGKFQRSPKFGRYRILNVFLFFEIYMSAMATVIFLAFNLRNYTISQMSTVFDEDYTAVSVTYIEPVELGKITSLVFENRNVQTELDKLFSEKDKIILYILPKNWSVEELGMVNTRDRYTGQDGPSMRSSSHGNPIDDKPMEKRVIISHALLIEETKEKNILYSIKQQVPKLYVDIDLRTEGVTNITKTLPTGIYGNIPVPIY